MGRWAGGSRWSLAYRWPGSQRSSCVPEINSIEDHHSDGLQLEKASNSKALPNSTAISTIKTPLLASYDLKIVLYFRNDQYGGLPVQDHYWTIFRNTVGALW